MARHEVTFEDSTTAVVNTDQANEVVGKGYDGEILVKTEIGIIPLTTCCQSSGKGSYPGVVCRHCYRPVDSYYGSIAYEHDIAVQVAAMVIS